MNTFHDLFRQPTRRVGSASPPDRRRELFPGFVERSPKLHLWSADQPIPAQGPRLLIGVATWSGYDMNLLDLIEEAPDNGVRVDVFDVDSVPSAELPRTIPNTSFLQTPFVGYWVDGKLAESASGFDGRKLVARVCGLDLTEVEDRMNTVTSRV
ncbi:MAG: hypothetical protein L0241_20290 [Planctomycetia bacterium]|nr:hypothetical protein [Planctomycetia bacterium]